MDGETYLVMGLGRSGRAVARLLAREGRRVILTDDSQSVIDAALGAPELLEVVGSMRAAHAGSASGLLGECDAVIASPGVPLDHPLLEAARGKGIVVTGEIEVAYRYCSAPIIAVTGTNGKSTVVKLTGTILETAGKKTVVAGNIGTPFAAVVERGESYDAVVLEVSSFQLDTIIDFKADVAALLNVTADHLDRYRDSFELYVRSKARILNRATRETVFVYNADDAECARIAGGFAGRKIPFSSSAELEEGVCHAGGEIVRRSGGRLEPIAPRSSFAPIGVHNLENALAAVSLATPFGVPRDRIRAALESYTPLPHRMEIVRTVNDVVYIDDSKATNVDATIKSLRSVDGPVVVILGGSDKNLDFRPLVDHLGKVKIAVLIGQTREKIRSVIAGRCAVTDAASMDEAVHEAAAAASPGDTVLLAPACASFDMFTDYAHRGNVFRRAVEAL